MAEISARRVRVFAAALAFLAGVTSLGTARAAVVDAVVVRFRGHDSLIGASVLPPGHHFLISKALRISVAEIGRTTDGAFRLALAPALPFEEARAAINRLRGEPQVLYVNATARDQTHRAVRVQPKAGGPDPPLHRIIVKYREPALQVPITSGPPPSQQRLDRVASLAGTAVGYERIMFNGAYLLRLFTRLPRAQLERITDTLAKDAEVEWAQPDYLDRIALAPNDAFYSSQWHYFDPTGGVNLPAAWNRTTGSSAVKIAVIDTGALSNHPDLAGKFVGGYDFIYDYIVANDGTPAQPGTCTPTLNPLLPPCVSSRDSDPSDPGDWITASEDDGTAWGGWLEDCANPSPGGQFDPSSWHGTHVAGTIAALTNNSVGVAGVNWVSQIVPVRVLGKCGGYSSDIADGIEWASGGTIAGVPANANPAQVLNLSLGGRRSNQSCDPVYQAAITNALGRNAVVVVAAGNANEEASFHTPGNCNGVITVAATGLQGQRASYSNFDNNDASGVQVEIAAPGGSDFQYVLSTLNSGTTVPLAGGYNYVYYQGTSMATPHVAGIASLMLSVNPAKTPAQILAAVQTTARPFPSGTIRDCTANLSSVTSGVKYCGAGIIDADAAIAAVTPPVTTTMTLTTSGTPSTLAQPVTFTATVTGNAPTGVVLFAANGTAIRRCNEVPLSGTGNTRTAQCQTNALPLGTHSIGAAYEGDGSNGPATATPLTQVVNGSGPPPMPTKQRDFNGDFRGDLLWRAASNGGHSIWLMTGTTPEASAGIAIVAPWVVTHTTDFDGDGRSDLLLRNPGTGETSIWLMSGTTMTGSAVILTSTAWSVILSGDLNGDGRADLVWRNAATGEISLWLMNGTASTGSAIVSADPNLQPTHVADFNGDGKSDLLWRHSGTGQNTIWLMNGLTASSVASIFTSTDWSVNKTGDFDGDGKADLLWRSALSNAISLWFMNGTTKIGSVLWPIEAGWQVTHIADFNGDGRSDIVSRQQALAQTAIWLVNGSSIVGSAGLSLPGSVVTAIGDYDGDGRADIVWHNPMSGATDMHLMNGTGVVSSARIFTSLEWAVLP